MSENSRKGGDEQQDDAYIIEDTGGTIEDLEREMKETAAEAVADPVPGELTSEENPSLLAENAALKTRYVRTLADFENFRKRNDREKADFFKYALANFMRDLLPVLDNFDRSLDHAEEGDEFHRGVLLIYKQLFDVLQRHGLRPIDENGVHFDPNIHEAVIREEDPTVPSQTVVEILQRGYFLHDRLLRPALVKVAVGGSEPGA